MGLFDHRAVQIHPVPGEELVQLRGRVTLVVNVASECGFTQQYAGLQALHDELAPRGFSVVAFPCDQFGGQEPGDPSTIASFCHERFGVTFPVFEKLEVLEGAARSPIYTELETELGAVPTWNFAKALCDREGNWISLHGSRVVPEDERLREDIERLLLIPG